MSTKKPVVLVPLANGFEDVEAVTIVDVLRRGDVEVVTASLNAERYAVSAHGIRMSADALLGDVLENAYDAIILPGGGEGTQNLLLRDDLLARLRRQKDEGGLVAAICAAPTVLDAAGVIDDESVTCYPACAVQMGCRVENVPVVADGQVVTGQGPGASMMFALALLANLRDERTAQQVANGMVFEFA